MNTHTPLKVLTCNIEAHRHLNDRVLPFIQAQQPDVFCLQELFKQDIPALELNGEYQSFFSPMTEVKEANLHIPDTLGELGVGIFVRKQLEVVAAEHHYYVGIPDNLPTFFQDQNPNAMNRVLRTVTLVTQERQFTLGTTHFTWSPQGKATDEQQQDVQALLEIIATQYNSNLILMGDFNAPRGGELFATLAAVLTDAVPAEYTTSIDPILHKAGALELLVDGLFLGSDYTAKEVLFHQGVSDHQAITAMVYSSHHVTLS